MTIESWLAKAIFYAQFCVDQIKLTPNHPLRGIVASSDPGVSVIYACDSEIGRIKVRLVSEGIEILGEGNATLDNRYIVTLLVRSTDVRTLQRFVTDQTDDSPATTK